MLLAVRARGSCDTCHEAGGTSTRTRGHSRGWTPRPGATFASLFIHISFGSGYVHHQRRNDNCIPRSIDWRPHIVHQASMVRTDIPATAPHIEIPITAESARLTPPAATSPGGTALSSSPSSVSSTFGSIRSDSTALSSPATTPPTYGSSGHDDGGPAHLLGGRKDSGGVPFPGETANQTDPSVSLRRGRSVKYMPDAFPGYAERANLVPDSPSSVSSKDEETPRAERPQPVWPLSQIQNESGAAAAKKDEAANTHSASSLTWEELETTIPSRVASLRRRYAP